MPTSVSNDRKEVVDSVFSNLHYISTSGFTYLGSLSHSALDGYIDLGVLKRWTKELMDVPEEYIYYAIEKEDPPRLELDYRRKSVRILREPYREQCTQTGGDLTCEAQNTDTQADNALASVLPSDKSRHNQAEDPDITNPAKKDDDDDDAKGAAGSPTQDFVYYEDGKFYKDTLVPVKPPEYDPPDIAQSVDGVLCWNCEQPGHAIAHCGEAWNPKRVQRNRERQAFNRMWDQRRLCDSLVLQDKVEHLVPGQLSSQLVEALDCQYREPPYYGNMRLHGYPPGYWGRAVDEDPVRGPTQQRRRTAAQGWIHKHQSMLIIYDEKNIEKCDLSVDDNVWSAAASTSSRTNVKMVHYPGLNLPDHSSVVDHYASKSLPLNIPTHMPSNKRPTHHDFHPYPSNSYPLPFPQAAPPTVPSSPYVQSHASVNQQDHHTEGNFNDSDMDVSDGEE